MTNNRFQTIKKRFSQTNRNILHSTFYYASDRIIFFHCFFHSLLNILTSSNLNYTCFNIYSLNYLFSNNASSDKPNSQSTRKMPASAIIIKSIIFPPRSKIRMPGAWYIFDKVIIIRFDILILKIN